MFAGIAKSFDPKALRLKNILFFFVIALSILALARPQWGYEMRDMKRKGVDIMLVIDVSRSMLTQDVKPNRLERTKLAVKDLIKKLKGDRIGLIAFAGDAFLVCPLTVDYGGFLLSLEDLSPNTISRGGTNIAHALQEAIKEYGDGVNKHKALVLITDGDNLEEDPMPVVQKAKEKEIKVFCVGVGTQEGELIRVPNKDGQMDFLKDNQGNFVKSRLNESLLQRMALDTGGVYVRASGAQFGLDLLYDRELSRFEKKEFQTKSEKRYYERFQFPLAIVLLLLIIEMVVPTRKRIEEES